MTRPNLPRMGAPALVYAACAAALVTGSCGKDAPLPPPPAIVDVTMREYGFDHPRSIPRGRVVFRARNMGGKRHEILLLSLPEDFPPLDEQLRGKQRRPVLTRAYLHEIRPGTSDAFAVDLSPGRYGMVCLVEDPDRSVHGAKGMNSEFRVN